MLKPKLTQHGLLYKKFKSKMRGYDPGEVDRYLDQVIKDYGAFKAIIDEQKRRIAMKNVQNRKLRQELNDSKPGNMTKRAYLTLNQGLNMLQNVIFKKSHK